MSRPDSPAPRPISSSTLGAVYKQTSPYAVVYERTESEEDPEVCDNERRTGGVDIGAVNTGLKDEEEKDEVKEKDGPPDGGCLAWAIVAASFMVSFLQVQLTLIMYKCTLAITYMCTVQWYL